MPGSPSRPLPVHAWWQGAGAGRALSTTLQAKPCWHVLPFSFSTGRPHAWGHLDAFCLNGRNCWSFACSLCQCCSSPSPWFCVTGVGHHRPQIPDERVLHSAKEEVPTRRPVPSPSPAPTVAVGALREEHSEAPGVREGTAAPQQSDTGFQHAQKPQWGAWTGLVQTPPGKTWSVGGEQAAVAQLTCVLVLFSKILSGFALQCSGLMLSYLTCLTHVSPVPLDSAVAFAFPPLQPFLFLKAVSTAEAGETLTSPASCHQILCSGCQPESFTQRYLTSLWLRKGRLLAVM